MIFLDQKVWTKSKKDVQEKNFMLWKRNKNRLKAYEIFNKFMHRNKKKIIMAAMAQQD